LQQINKANVKLVSIETTRFRVDGGAMYGVVPKTMWSRHSTPDQNNMVELACRSLLIDTGSHVILIDTGLGNKSNFDDMKHYAPDTRYSLEASLQQAGYTSASVTHVINTHLHFDHCGGNTIKAPNGTLLPAFENANYYLSKAQYQSATHPNRREKASFLVENFLPIAQAGRLTLLENQGEFLPGISLRFFHGHTAGLTAVFITVNEKTLVFAGDMLPAAAFVPMSWISAYDIEPLKVMAEKSAFLEEAVENNYALFLQHDAQHECALLHRTEKGIRVQRTLQLSQW